MDMFTSYQNLSEYYIPNNLSKKLTSPKSYTKLDPNEKSKPYELYNAKGELEGYYWHEGDQLVLDFSIDGEVTVESSAIIFDVHGEIPTEDTEARLSQRAYNIQDLRSWTCVSFRDNKYIWQEDAEFTYPLDSLRSVFIDASDYLRDKIANITIYNFKFEPIYTKDFNANTSIKLYIDKELSDRLTKGIYYCSLTISGTSSRETLFSSNDCKLLVK